MLIPQQLLRVDPRISDSETQVVSQGSSVSVALCTLQAHLTSCIIIVSIFSIQYPHSHRVYIEKGRRKSSKLSGMSVTKSVGSGGVVSAEGSSWDLFGVNVIVLEDCSLALLRIRQEEGEEHTILRCVCLGLGVLGWIVSSISWYGTVRLTLLLLSLFLALSISVGFSYLSVPY
jgi:hypothetical protein